MSDKLHFGEFSNLTFQAVLWSQLFLATREYTVPATREYTVSATREYTVSCYSQSLMLLSKSHATLKVPCYSQSPMLL